MSPTRRIITTVAIAMLGAAMTSPRGSPGSPSVPLPETPMSSAGADASAGRGSSSTPVTSSTPAREATSSARLPVQPPTATRAAAMARQAGGVAATGAAGSGVMTRSFTGAVRVSPRH